MTRARETDAILTALREGLPELALIATKRPFVAVTPIGRVLRALYAETSSRRGEKYVEAFVLPLYVPTDHVHFTLGFRIGGGSRTWSVTELDALVDAARSDAVPFLRRFAGQAELAHDAELAGATNLHKVEMRAYSLAAVGEHAQAGRALEQLIARLDPAVAWEAEMRARAAELARCCAHDRDGATALLARWEAATRAALRLAA